MHNNLLSFTSIIISSFCLFITLFWERRIYLAYVASTGKERALFGLNELRYFEGRMLLVMAGVIALILILIATARRESRLKIIAGLILSIIAIVVPFLRIWQWFI